MNILINKKCAVCGNEVSCYTEKYKDVLLQENIPFGEGAEAFYILWHNELENCKFCNYINSDIEQCDERIKKIVLSKEYKKCIINDILEEISEFSNCDAKSFESYGLIQSLLCNYFESATGYLRAFYCTRQGANDWRFQMEKDNAFDNEEVEIFTSAINVSKEYLKKAKSELMNVLKKNPEDYNSLFLLIYVYYYLEEKVKARNICNKLLEASLTNVQSKILKYLTTLVNTDKFE